MEENVFKRKRGELELLTDISNIPLNATSKRACTAKTGEKIENIPKVKAIGRHASAPPPECPPSQPSRMKSIHYKHAQKETRVLFQTLRLTYSFLLFL